MHKHILIIISVLIVLPLYGSHINWQEIEESSKYAVIQVLNHSEPRNPFEPFKKNYNEQKSSGSGFFINENGEFLTNYHVIGNAKKIEISLPSISRKRFEAELVGCKPERDVALCRLTKTGLTKFKTFLETVPGCNGIIQYLLLADDDQLKPVQEVMALGYPLNDGFKRTIGHINGLSLHTGTLYCQITAPINQGSSGGPTLNEHGQVIGINSAGIPGTNVVCYMIPLHYFRNLIADMRTTKVITNDFGAYLQPTTSNIIDTHHCPNTGMLVTHVLPGSLADDMGIQLHDIVTAINDHQLDNDGLIKVDWIDARVPYDDTIERMHIGDELTITIWRNDTKITLTGTIPAASSVTIDKVYPEQGPMPYRAFGGIVVQPLRLNHITFAANKTQGMINPDLYTFLHKPEHLMKDQLIITKVYNCSQAEYEHSLCAGALLSKVNGMRVQTLEELDQAVAKTTGDFISLTMHDHRTAALHVPTMLAEDEDLRNVYEYQKAPGIQALEGKKSID